MNASVSLRPLAESDGPGLAGLSYSSPDSGRIRYAVNYQVDAVQAVRALHGELEAVTASTVAGTRMVGFGLNRYGECQFQGETLPFALLGNLIVHPDFRGKGLAAQLIAWQIEHARARTGEQGLLLANFQRGNQVSRRLFARWLEHLAGPLIYFPQPMLPEPPPTPPGLSAGPLDPVEYAGFTAQLNQFYEGWNFHQPCSAASLYENCRRSPFPTPIRHAYTVVDARGTLLAGLVVMEEYRLKEMEVRGLPPGLRLANRLLKFIPADGTVRELYLDHLWFRPGQAPAARHLINTVRWIWAGRANVVSVLFDPRSPLGALFPTRPWSIFTPTSMALHSPLPFDPARWIRPIY
jgi:GNAT superfamily N-acetyltransferase